MLLTKVILVCNNNPLYYQYANDIYDLWEKRIKIKPHLFIISEEKLDIDFGDRTVQYIKPIPDIPTAFQSQVIRLLLPCLFKDDYSIISDIDMLPIKKKMFKKFIKRLNDDMFIQYFQFNQMCYNCAKGETWQKVFQVSEISQIQPLIKKWYLTFKGHRTTDQIVLGKYMDAYKGPKIILTTYLPNNTFIHRLSSLSDVAMIFDVKLEDLKKYVDFHAHGIFHDPLNIPFYKNIVKFLLQPKKL